MCVFVSLFVFPFFLFHSPFSPFFISFSFFSFPFPDITAVAPESQECSEAVYRGELPCTKHELLERNKIRWQNSLFSIYSSHPELI